MNSARSRLPSTLPAAPSPASVRTLAPSTSGGMTSAAGACSVRPSASARASARPSSVRPDCIDILEVWASDKTSLPERIRAGMRILAYATGSLRPSGAKRTPTLALRTAGGVRAFVLAAGEGRRLRPLTDAVPKPMIPIRGRPILEHNVRMLARAGVTEIVVNLHHRGETIVEHFGDGSLFGVAISYVTEPELLGTAGALNAV